MNNRKFPIGIADFRSIRSDDYYYIDKTPHIERLIGQGRYYFLSRPRRFGKSLLLDTMLELFEGSEPLFRGLYIHDRWDWSTQYPIVRLSFNAEYSRPGVLEENVKVQLENLEIKHGLSDGYDSTNLHGSNRFARLLHNLHAKTGKQAVVLIDEYDEPEVMEYLNGFSKFPDVAQIFRIHRHVKHYKKGVVTKTTDEVAVGFTSLPADRANPKSLLDLNRRHWTIESVHHVLDSLKTWQEDHLLIRKGNGPENLTALRRFAIAVIKRHSKKVASTIRKLKCDVRLLLDYLCLTENTRRRRRAVEPASAAC